MSVRVTTDQQGNIATERGDYPYGDEWYETGAAMASVARKFHRYRIETELPNSVLNASLAREHSARLGRFQTPDVRQGRVTVPQRMNRYSYASDDPINRWDPRGTADGPCVDDCDDVPLQCLVPDCGTGDPDGGPYGPMGGGDGGDDPPVVVQPPDQPCSAGDPSCSPPTDPCDPSDPSCNPPCDPSDPACGVGLLPPQPIGVPPTLPIGIGGPILGVVGDPSPNCIAACLVTCFALNPESLWFPILCFELCSAICF